MSPVPTYAAPLWAIDRIVGMDEAGIVTERTVVASEPYLRGHYPLFPVYPGVFMIEAVNQAANAFAAHSGLRVCLRQIRSTRFRAAVRPSDTLQCNCRCKLTKEGSTLEVDATCRRGAVIAASVKLSYEVEGGLV